MAKKFADQEDFTLDDFLAQCSRSATWAAMKKMLMMMPGAPEHPPAAREFDERDRPTCAEAIVRSMTPHERVAPKIINGSRRARIASGSGVHVSEVNGLLERFAQAQKMMKKMAPGRRDAGHAGDARPGWPRGARKGAKTAPKEGPLRQPGQGGPGAHGRRGPPCRGREGPADRRSRSANRVANFDPSQLNLPKGFDKFLGGSKYTLLMPPGLCRRRHQH